MKMTIDGMEVELTPEEYIRIGELTGGKKGIDVKNLSFEDEMTLLYSLKYFEVIETEMSSFGTVTVTLKSDLS